MKLPPLLPPKLPVPIPDPITIFEIVKTVAKFLFGDKEKKDLKEQVGKKKSMDLQKSEISDISELNAVLNEYVMSMQSKVTLVESQIIDESYYFFDEFFERLEAMNENNNNELFVKLNRHKTRFSRIQKKIKGTMANYLSKRISLDDEECRSILKMLPSESKSQKMDAFTSKVLNEAIEVVTTLIKESMNEYGEELIEIVVDRMNEMEQLENEKLGLIQQMEASNQKDEQKCEEVKLNSMLKSDMSTYALRELAKEMA